MPRGVSISDEARLQGRLWSPILVQPAVWLDASDISTISVATGVSEWRDKSGNARHVSQGASARQPSIATFNGLNAVNFDGVNDVLDNATSITSGTYTGSFNTFYVATRNSVGGGTILTERTTYPLGSVMFGSAAGVNYISSNGIDIKSNHTISNTSYNTLSTAGAIAVHEHFPAVRDNFWLNGQSQTVLLGTATNITGTGGLRIGGREAVVGFYWSGLIMEVIVTLTPLTTIQRQQIEGSLAWKWGLQNTLIASHPFRNRPPLIGD
jgi:hypothetical protein